MDLGFIVVPLYFLARDKELSTFSDYSIGIGASYEFAKHDLSFIDKGSINFYFSYFDFNYDNFTDITKSTPTTVGQEPAYNFSANVLRFFVSIWF